MRMKGLVRATLLWDRTGNSVADEDWDHGLDNVVPDADWCSNLHAERNLRVNSYVEQSFSSHYIPSYCNKEDIAWVTDCVAEHESGRLSHMVLKQ